MKRIFIILCLLAALCFALLPLAASAQDIPLLEPTTHIATAIPGVDPAIQQVVSEALPAKYASYGSAFILGIMILGRFLTALANGRGIKGWLSAIINGTNGPKVLIAALCLLALPSCADTTDPTEIAKRQRNITIGQRGLNLLERYNIISPQDAIDAKEIGTLIINVPAKQPKNVQPVIVNP